MENNVLKVLREKVAELGSQKAVADELRISEGYLSDMLTGRRDISEQVARALGFQKVVTYVEVEP